MQKSCAVIGATTLVAAALNLSQAAPTAPPSSEDPAELSSAWPEEVGVDSTKLVKLSKWIRENKYDIRSLVIVKDGRVVFERYSAGLGRDNNYEMYSITKAATSVLAGKLIDEGKISLDSSVRDVVGAWRPDLKEAVADKGAITLRNVLSMTTGLRYDFKPPKDPIYYEASDRLKLAAGTTPALTPGKVFQYMDVNPVIATAMLSAAAGKRIEEYAEEKLFRPLGMKRYAWTRADQAGLVSGGWGLRLRALDMAKLGMLTLQDGRWENQQVVPADWVRQMTSGQSTPFFGYYWWINNIVESGGQREYDTMGFKGQNIVVLPEHNAVVTMTSMLPVDGGLRDAKCLQIMRYMMSAYLLPALGGRPSSPDEALKRELVAELQVAKDSLGQPGVAADPTDTPQ
ncbi:serine hydrolase [Methylobacterium radiodurans]|uniref:Serine hydrolase n=2 Tax=Methylobacterium radiodurans TaxID=2202828 RepID=A0A2U8W0L5_9HYPH|nr:serine hydrolase [Methylobacterium radiodurans]